MYHDKDGITSSQLSVTLVMTVLGIGILVLPRSLTVVTQSSDGWLTILIGGLLFWLLCLWAFSLVKGEGHRHLFLILERRLGRWMSKVLAAGWLLYALLFSMIEVRYLAQALHIYLLERTPLAVTMALILIPSSFVAYKGWIALCRLNQLYIPIVALVVLIVVALSARPSFDWTNLLPLFHQGFWPVVEALPYSIFSFLGFEVVLVLGAYLKRPEQGYRAIHLASGGLVLIYLLIFIMCLGTFGYRQVGNILFPFVALTENIKFPGGFFERFELLVFSAWILLLFTTIAAMHLLGYLALQHLLDGRATRHLQESAPEAWHKRRISPFRMQLVLWFALFMYLFALWPHDFNHLISLAHLISCWGFGFLLMTMLLLSLRRGKTRQRKEADSG